MRSLILVLTFAVTGLLSEGPLHGDIADPTTVWNVVPYSGIGEFDYSDDQQTGNRDSDIVGDSNHAAFYTRFDGAGTSSLIDGTWSCRVRIGSDRPQSGTFDNNLFVGVDANMDGALDLFLGVHNQGSNESLAIWSPGSGANVSPSTTSIVSPPAYTFAQNSTNYLFSAVTSTNDPTATNFDLDADGDTDFFLSFSLDFAEIVNQMQLIAGISINERTPLAFVLATANSDNALNQDLNGANGGIGSSTTWQELGVYSSPTSFSGNAIPEPGTATLLLLIGMAGLVRRGSRARRLH